MIRQLERVAAVPRTERECSGCGRSYSASVSCDSCGLYLREREEEKTPNQADSTEHSAFATGAPGQLKTEASTKTTPPSSSGDPREVEGRPASGVEEAASIQKESKDDLQSDVVTDAIEGDAEEEKQLAPPDDLSAPDLSPLSGDPDSAQSEPLHPSSTTSSSKTTVESAQDKLQEMEVECRQQHLCLYRCLVRRLVALWAVADTHSGAGCDYHRSVCSTLVERLDASVSSAATWTPQPVANLVIGAAIRVTGLLSFEADLNALEAGYEISAASRIQDWRSDCTEYLEFIAATADAGEPDQGETQDEQHEGSLTALDRRHVQRKFVATLPSFERERVERLFIELLPPSLNEADKEPSSWFISIAECECDAEHLDSWWWNGTRVKLVPYPSGNAEDQSRCHQHASKWAGLECSSLVQLYGACDAGVPFLVCESVEGETLAAYMRAARPPRETLWVILYQAALGLSWLHGRGVVCGNITCEDVIFCSASNQVKLDFHTQSPGRAFADGIMARRHAPEIVAEDDRTATIASDVYNFGVAIYEVLEGHHSWSSDTDDLVGLVQRMTAHDPSDRPSMTDVVSVMYSQLVQPGPSMEADFRSHVEQVDERAWVILE